MQRIKCVFVSIFSKEVTENILKVNEIFNDDNSRTLSNIVITPEEVFNKVTESKDGKAPGNDGIITEFLKSLACEISENICLLFLINLFLRALSNRSGRELILHNCSKKENGLNQQITDQ